ncbi:MAG TPA: hypothetical protein VHB21_14805, partial [Minicystis sp.]|nr:hypothetical protein [Minicystis sp.]
MLAAIDAYLARIALPETLRTLPLLACAVALFVLGLRVRRGAPGALGAVQIWAYWMAAAIVVSVGVQIAFTLPATTEYAASLSKAMPMPPPRGGAAPRFDPGAFIGLVTTAATGLGIALGAVVYAVLPVVLHVWAGKLRAATGR